MFHSFPKISNPSAVRMFIFSLPTLEDMNERCTNTTTKHTSIYNIGGMDFINSRTIVDISEAIVDINVKLL